MLLGNGVATALIVFPTNQLAIPSDIDVHTTLVRLTI